MAIDKLSGNSFATGAISNNLGYTPLSATAPSAVANSSANVVYMAANGNVGIGTSTPGGQGSGASGPFLNVISPGTSSSNNGEIVVGSAGVANGSSLGCLGFATTGTAAAEKRGALVYAIASANSATAPVADLTMWTNNGGTFTEKMRIAANGNIGVGTSTPGTKVAIVSNSSIQGLKITSTNDWGNISTPFVDIDGNANSTGDGNILRVKTGAARTDVKIFEIVNGNGTLYYIRGDGLKVRNGVAEQIIAFDSMAGNTTYNYDITVGNEGGAGNLIEVHAMFDHFYSFSYGAGIIAIIGKRQTSIAQQNIWNYTSGNGGSWSFSSPDVNTLRITKNAGSYSGAGYGHILVRWKKFD